MIAPVVTIGFFYFILIENYTPYQANKISLFYDRKSFKIYNKNYIENMSNNDFHRSIIFKNYNLNLNCQCYTFILETDFSITFSP